MLTVKGRLGLATLACVGLAIAISVTSAAAWKRGAVQTFALIPSGDPMVLVEGLAVGLCPARGGHAHATTCGLNRNLSQKSRVGLPKTGPKAGAPILRDYSLSPIRRPTHGGEG